MTLIHEVIEAAERERFEMRLTKRRWSDVRLRDQTPAPVLAHCRELRAIAQADATPTTRVRVSEVHMQAEHKLELAQVLAKAWAAFHANAPLWRTTGSLHA